MPDDSPKTAEIKPSKLSARLSLVLLVLLIGGVVVVPVAFYLNGLAGVIAAMVAFSICTLAGLLALTASHYFAGRVLVQQVLLPMGIRMAIPLAACALLYLRPGPLVQAGMVYYMLVFYGLTLAVETFVMARGVQDAEASPTS